MPTEPYYPCSAGCANCPRRAQCAETTDLEHFLLENPTRGTLRIQAFRGPQTFPVPGLAVTVSHAFPDGSEYVFYTGTTDESGLIRSISLPAPERESSLKPDQPHPDAAYIIRAQIDGLAPMAFSVAIFPEIETVQPIQLRLE